MVLQIELIDNIMISLIIPVSDKANNYTNNIVKHITELYPNRSEIEIIVHNGGKISLGHNWNQAVSKASGEKIIILHNDMIISKNFIETMNKHICKNRITTYTRIEPPIYTDTYPGKKIIDCGDSLETFDQIKFNEIHQDEYLIDGGSQMFIGCLKEDFIGLDGDTFQMFCEDEDIHLRYKLLGFEHKVSSAFVYHFVSKTSRTPENRNIEYYSNKNFIRKWGFRNSQYHKKYNIGFVIDNCSYEFLETIEPWCSYLYSNTLTSDMITQYINKEQQYTNTNLSNKISNNIYPINDIIVHFDQNNISSQNINIIQYLSDIITDINQVGQFNLNVFNILINNLNTYEQKFLKFYK